SRARGAAGTAHELAHEDLGVLELGLGERLVQIEEPRAVAVQREQTLGVERADQRIAGIEPADHRAGGVLLAEHVEDLAADERGERVLDLDEPGQPRARRGGEWRRERTPAERALAAALLRQLAQRPAGRRVGRRELAGVEPGRLVLAELEVP